MPAKFGYVLAEILLLIVVTGFAYSNIFNNDFVFDDYRIWRNPHIRLTTLSFDEVADTWRNSQPATRPVANLSFALNYFFHRYEVGGYHLVNILIHITAGLFLYLLTGTTLKLLSARNGKNYSRWLPFLVALLWLVHPVQTQSVAYTVQRMNSLAAMFYLVSLFAYVKGRLARRQPAGILWFGGCAVAGLLALGSKEIAVTLPFFLVLYDWYFLGDLNTDWVKKNRVPLLAALLVVLPTVFLLYDLGSFADQFARIYQARGFTLTERLLTEARVVVFYLSLLFFPSPARLNLDHDFAVSTSLLVPSTTVMAVIILASLSVLAVISARRYRLLSFGIIWFLGNLAVESTVIPLEIVYDHRIYLPSTFALFALVFYCNELVAGRNIKMAGAVILVLVLTFWTYQRNQVWRTEVSLWSDAVKKSPAKARIHNNLGVALADSDQMERAAFHFKKVIELKPSAGDAYNNLATYWVNVGNLIEAEKLYLEALRLTPNEGAISYSLGTLYNKLGKTDLAKKYFLRSIDLHKVSNSYLAMAYNNLAEIYESEGRWDLAQESYSKAIEFDPMYYLSYYNLVGLLMKRGENREASRVRLEARRLFPDKVY